MYPRSGFESLVVPGVFQLRPLHADMYHSSIGGAGLGRCACASHRFRADVLADVLVAVFGAGAQDTPLPLAELRREAANFQIARDPLVRRTMSEAPAAAPQTPAAPSPDALVSASPSSAAASTYASTPPSTCSRSSQNRSAWIISRIPEHKKTGNYNVDIANQDNRQALRDLVTLLLEDDSAAPGLLAEARRRRQANTENIDDRDCFIHNSTLGKLDEEWIISWLVHRSDLSSDDIISMKKHDTEAVKQLLLYELQMPLTTKMNPASKDKAVAKRVCDARADEMGRRLKDFRKVGFSAGSANWMNKCYKFVWTSETFDAKVKEVRHWNGEIAEVPDHCIITQQHVLQYNWSDWLAQVARSPLPPLRLCDLFKMKRNGPWSYPQPAKAKDFERMCQRVADEVQVLREQLNPAESVVVQAAAKLQELSSEKKARALANAREKAKQSMTEAKRRRTLTMDA